MKKQSMKEKIVQLYDLQKKNLVLSPWGRETSLYDRTKELRLEVDEAIHEIEQQDWEKFADEIGDVLWDCLGVIAKAEKEGHLTMNQLLDHIYTKYQERKPFLFEGREATREEETAAWHRAKEKQKKRNL